MSADVKDRLADYTQVKDRIPMFYTAHPEGRLVTAEVRFPHPDDDPQRISVKALAYRTPDDPHPAVGWSWMELPGKTSFTRGSELENTETSAWGRAIGALGLGIAAGIGSKDEIDSKAGDDTAPPPSTEPVAISRGLQSYTGKVLKGDGGYNNLEPTGTPTGYRIGFRLDLGTQKIDEVVCDGPLGLALYGLVDDLKGAEVTVEGEAFRVEQPGRKTRARLIVSKIVGPFGTFPGDVPPEMPDDGKATDLDDLPW